MSASLIVSLLSQRPSDELEELRDKMQADIARLHADIARGQVELAQVEEALSRQARREARSSGGSKTGTTRARVLEVLAATHDLMSPVEIIAALKEQGVTPSRGAIYTLLGRLLEAGTLERIDGRYKLASRVKPGAFSDSSRNGAGEPPSTATRPQEGAQKVLGS